MNRTISDAGVGDETRAFVYEAYTAAGDGKAVDHPLSVAGLLREDGQPDFLVLTGLLHDLLEDTGVDAAELRERFGPEVTRLVEALTQDDSISDYKERKAALRRQIVEAGPDAATVALADKTAKLAFESSRPKESRLDHYRATLQSIEARHGRSRLSERLRGELERFPPSAD